MSISKKGSRNITVNNQQYRYIVGSEKIHKDYVSVLTIQAKEDGGQTCQWSTGKYVITPGLVRTVILHALKNNWKPLEKGSMLVVTNVDISEKNDCFECKGCYKLFPRNEFEDLNFQYCSWCI